MAVAAVSMCLMFILLDMGSPERFWHLIPVIGIFNWPGSILTWDVIVLNVYLVLNLTLVTYALSKIYAGKSYKTKLIMPFIYLSIPAAISIHTGYGFSVSRRSGKTVLEHRGAGPEVYCIGILFRPCFYDYHLSDHQKIFGFKNNR